MPALARALVLTAALVATAAPAAAAQTTGRCPQADPSVTCHRWTGEVTFIGDGDTLSVDVDGDGTKKPVRVRMTGINTPEQTVYTDRPEDRVGECHANEATARLEQLVAKAKGRVLLSAQDPASSSLGRARRAVAIRQGNRWRDLGRTLMREGHAFFLSMRGEWQYNKSYSIRAQWAEAARREIWNSEECAPGPPAYVRTWAQPDPEGNEGNNPNGEFIKVRNMDAVNPVDVSGWRVRDSGLRGYLFPAGSLIPPGGTVTVYVGQGVDAPPDYFWNLTGGVFDNVRPERFTGDGAYVYDADGDLRAAMQYPCRYRCNDVAIGALAIRGAFNRRNEFIGLKNTSDRPVDVEGYRLASPPYSYMIGADSVLAPGEELRVYVKGDPALNTHLERYWGKPKNILGGNDLVQLKSARYVDIVCAAWGTKSCEAPAG
jgi:endonuclease YncB( thermonuclease family)